MKQKIKKFEDLQLHTYEGVICENQDSWFGGGYTVKYEGKPIAITIKKDGTEQRYMVTYIDAWVRGIEHCYCTIVECKNDN